jgi:hypothetical protein
MNLLNALFPARKAPRDSYCLDPSLSLGGRHGLHQPTGLLDPTLTAQVEDPILPGQLGHVTFQGCRWRACHVQAKPLCPGQKVRVVGRYRSNILVVEPLCCDLKE